MPGAASLTQDSDTCVDILLPEVHYNGLSSSSDTDDQDDDPCMEDDEWEAMVKRPSLGLDDYPLFGAQYLAECPFDPFTHTNTAASNTALTGSNPFSVNHGNNRSTLNHNANNNSNPFSSYQTGGSGDHANNTCSSQLHANFKSSSILNSAAVPQSGPTQRNGISMGSNTGYNGGSSGNGSCNAGKGDGCSNDGECLPVKGNGMAVAANSSPVSGGSAAVGSGVSAQGGGALGGSQGSSEAEGTMGMGSQDANLDPRVERLERRRKSNRESARRMRAFRAHQMSSLQQEAECLRAEKQRLDAEQEAFEREYASALQENMQLRKRLLHLHTIRDATFSKADVMAYAYSGVPQHMPAEVPYCDAYYEPEQEQYAMYY